MNPKPFALSLLMAAVVIPCAARGGQDDAPVIDPARPDAGPADDSGPLDSTPPGRDPSRESPATGEASIVEPPTPAELPPVDPPSRPHARRGASRAIAGVTIAGLGVAALGLGTVSGFEALSKNRDSNAHGNCRGNLCDAAGFDARTTARSDGARATGLIGVGAAAIVIGAVLWLTVPGRHGTGGSGELKIGVSPSGARCAWVF